MRLAHAFSRALGDSLDKGRLVVQYIEGRAGLLIGQGEQAGERRFCFPHRSFQEFLAAAWLAARADFPARCRALADAAPGHWQLTLALAARLAQAERGASAADGLIGSRSVAEFSAGRTPGPADWTRALLAGAQLAELGLAAIQPDERTRAIGRRVAGWLCTALPVHPRDGGLPARRRAEAGDLLAVLGDPRFDPERLYLPADDLLGFVPIPADPEFRIGTRTGDRRRVQGVTGWAVGDEINDALTPVPAFYIARYPVTVAQFRAFTEAARVGPENDAAPRDPDNRPMRLVAWHEALAYCDWLHGQLTGGGSLAGSRIAGLVRQEGWRATLPSELEWERAARGLLRDTVFPWGDEPDPEAANYADSGIEDSSAVGCFPATGFGVHDLVGNLWEWTRSPWVGAYAKVTDWAHEAPRAEDRQARVVRGGSWGSRRDLARCAYRSGVLPDDRGGALGFRVVLRAAPVS